MFKLIINKVEASAKNLVAGDTDRDLTKEQKLKLQKELVQLKELQTQLTTYKNDERGSLRKYAANLEAYNNRYTLKLLKFFSNFARMQTSTKANFQIKSYFDFEMRLYSLQECTDNLA